MNDFTTILLNHLSGVSIALPLIAMIINRKMNGKDFRPFLTVIFLAFIAEILNITITEKLIIIVKGCKGCNTPVLNVYHIFEYILLLWQFYLWKPGSNKKKWFTVLVVSGWLIWITESLYNGNFIIVNSLYRICSAFIICLLAINEMNFQITMKSGLLLKNSVFLITVALLIYFSYGIFIEFGFFWEFQMGKKGNPWSFIYDFHVYVNIFVNFIYAVGIYFIPKKIQYIFPNYKTKRPMP